MTSRLPITLLTTHIFFIYIDSSKDIGRPSHLLGRRNASALTAYLIAVLRSAHPVISIFLLVSSLRSSPSPTRRIHTWKWFGYLIKQCWIFLITDSPQCVNCKWVFYFFCFINNFLKFRHVDAIIYISGTLGKLQRFLMLTHAAADGRAISALHTPIQSA